MRILLHDTNLPPGPGNEGIFAFSALPAVQPCVGCFGCWLKTPGRCVIRDRMDEFAPQLAAADALTIVSACCYGGYSPAVKAVLDRSIGYMLPFFEYVNGEMHHVRRYGKRLLLDARFYGADEAERPLAARMAAANALNFGGTAQTSFYETAREAMEL